MTSFRAGSGSYQAVGSILISPSAVTAGNVSVETFSATDANITQGSIAQLTTDSIIVAQWADPTVASLVGLFILRAAITATGTLQLTTFNPTGSTITPAAGVQLNFIVL